MKFKREARDRAQVRLEEGDILQVNSDTIAVVAKVVRHGREQFPDLQVTTITTDFLGKKVTTRRATYQAEAYKQSRRLDPSTLRDDVPKYQKAKELREKFIKKPR